MNERVAAIDDVTMKMGLLMESAQAHQKLAENQLQNLRAHTQDLDSVVRDEIRRTLVDELQMLTAETTRATQALEKVRRRAGKRVSVLSILIAIVCAVLPIAVAHWALPSAAQLETLRARREELSISVAKLEQAGGRTDWRRCGEARRLCVRVDRSAPTYGEKADFYVIAGY
jgi:hypothetical protein